MEDKVTVTNHYPDCDSITLEIGDYHIAVYLDGEYDRQTHVDIHDKRTNTTEHLVVGSANNENKPLRF